MMIKEQETMADKNLKTFIAAVAVLSSAVFAAYSVSSFISSVKNSDLTVSADMAKKGLKWTKQAIEEGTTIDAAYLWPDETDPVFTSVYRDGKQMDGTMFTLTSGSVYHFRGISDESVLYMEVYTGSISGMDASSGETGIWYHLLPSAIREDFENDGWVWQSGWEYSGRAYLDLDGSCVMIKAGDPTAVLYGVGLYLDDKYGYSSDAAFGTKGTEFSSIFGYSDNLFASALEYYYTRGGELRSSCPEIYAMVAEALSELDHEMARIREETIMGEMPGDGPDDGVIFMEGLLQYVNEKRSGAGLWPVAWDKDDDGAVAMRAKEVSVLFSQTRPDGSDAFSIYTDSVMCEMRLEDVTAADAIYGYAEDYFLNSDMISFTCAVYGDTTVLAFVW